MTLCIYENIFLFTSNSPMGVRGPWKISEFNVFRYLEALGTSEKNSKITNHWFKRNLCVENVLASITYLGASPKIPAGGVDAESWGVT